MENKKLLKFILRDLSELEELGSEKKDNCFDELEMEFLQTRISGAKRMIQILFDEEKSPINLKSDEPEINTPKEVGVQKKIIETQIEEPVIIEDKTETVTEKQVEKTETEIRKEIENSLNQIDEEIDEHEEIQDVETKEDLRTSPEKVKEKEIELADNEIIEEANKRLGDSFSKEKLVNDLIDVEESKLENKISNRPLESIKKAIGINDKFLFIRELFEGNAEVFTNAVAELDSKTDINEAVKYLQQNFKWKKNETSLKFVNLVKRRFSNE